MIATDVGWVEGRNPTPQNLVYVGFHFVLTPVTTTGGTPATHWLPNLRICRILFLNWYQNNPDNELLPEYDFDYGKAKPNRFASQEGKTLVTVILDSDVAEVFKTSADVNNALRALLSAIPRTEK